MIDLNWILLGTTFNDIFYIYFFNGYPRVAVHVIGVIYSFAVNYDSIAIVNTIIKSCCSIVTKALLVHTGNRVRHTICNKEPFSIDQNTGPVQFIFLLKNIYWPSRANRKKTPCPVKWQCKNNNCQAWSVISKIYMKL